MSLRLLGVGATLGAALIAAALAIEGFTRGDVPLWIVPSPVPMLSLEAGVTSLASPFLAIVALLATAVAIWGISRGRPMDSVMVAGFVLTMILVLIAQSVALFFLAWEAMALVSAFLVAAHHEIRGVRRATFTYLVVAQIGALLVLASLTILALQAGDPSFTSIARHAAGLPQGMRDLAFTLALIGFGSKAGAMPLHFWLPRAHPVAPANASALLSGAMLKVAIYGLILVAFDLAAPGPTGWGVALVIVGTVSAVAGVLYALVDHDLKRLLAYHSVENIGIILIGVGVALVARSHGNLMVAGLALTAALFHSINHGVFKGLLFLGAGTVADTAGTTNLERLGGLSARLRWTAPLFLIGCAAISALPPLNGFASEWLTFRALVNGLAAGAPAVDLVLLGSFAGLALTGGLAAACFVKVYGIAFLGRARHPDPQPITKERFDASALSLAFLAGLCIALGIAPMLAVGPLSAVSGALLGPAPIVPPTLPILPGTLVVLPLAGVAFALLLAANRKPRSVPTWTCGSPVTASAQYTATAFSKPVRTVFSFILRPERQRRIDESQARWFPTTIVYRTESRYLVDEMVRRIAAAMMRVARSSRAVQSGNLRLYITYAVAAVVVAVMAAR